MRKYFSVLFVSGVLLNSVALLASSQEATERNAAGAKFLQQGMIEPAIVEFQGAVALDPNYIAAQLNLGYAYERANRIEAAINAYQKAINLEPGNFFAHNNLGVLYDKKGRYDEAIVEFQNALKSEPGYVMAQKNLETARKNKTIAQQHEAQIAKAEKQAQANPNDPKLAYQLARLYAVYGMRDSALQWLTRAVRQGYKDFAALQVDPGFNNLRDDREFGLLLQGKLN